MHATFVMEQHLGHQTYYQNMRRFVEPHNDVQATWIPVTYNTPHRLGDAFGFLPESIRGTLRGRAEVRRGLAGIGGDVAFFNTQVPAVLGGAFTRQQPYVISTDITPIQYDEMSELYGHTPDRVGPLKAYKHHANVQTLRAAARLLPWSTWTRDSLVADYGVDPARVTVIPPGVDTALWTPGATNDSGPLRILFVGGDFERKGGATLLEAFRALPQGTAELFLVTRSAIEPETGVHVYSDLRPNDPRLLQLYQTSDVFALPSAAEAFGISAVEASASGLPAIVTNIGGLTDIIVDGVTGYLVQAGDTATISTHLHRLANDPNLRLRMRRAARERVEALFDARRNAEHVVTQLLKAVEENASIE